MNLSIITLFDLLSAMSSRALVLSLYRRQLKASKQFNTWNFRQYFARRAREEFQKNKNETDPVKIKAMIDKVSY